MALTLTKTEELLGSVAVRLDRLAAEREAEKEVEQKKWAERERFMERLSAKVDRVCGNVGGLNRSIGEIIQIIVIPGVMEKMNDLGHEFTMAAIEKEYYKIPGKNLVEVDLLLENGHEVMAIEVKTSVTENKVMHHLDGLKLLRKNETKTGLVGKTMYAGIAGLRFTDKARELARQKGMYVIEIEEADEKIEVVPPKKVGKW